MGNQIITIDGFSGSGKSTIGNLLAQRLGWVHLDSGKIMRSIYWGELNHVQQLTYRLENNIIIPEISNSNSLGKISCPSIALGLSKLSKNNSIIKKADKDIKDLIAYYQKQGLIISGRNFGEIFPHAKFRFLLKCSAKIRANRKNTIIENVVFVDQLELGKYSFLKIKNSEVITINTNEYTPEKILNYILKIFNNGGF